MRFNRYPRATPEAASPQRRRAAEKFVAEQKERYALFPEFCEDTDPDVRVERVLRGRLEYWQEMRRAHASHWRRARARLRLLPDGPQRAVRRYWQEGPLPASPEYLEGVIAQAENGKCFWHELAVMRRFRLICQGKLPNPWAQQP